MVFKIINIITCLIFIFYYLFLQKYLISKFFCKNSRSEYILIYWIDYIITVLILVLISISFSINLYINDNNKSERNNLKKLLTLIFDEYFPFFFESNFIMDIILSLDLLLKIKKIKINKGKKFKISYMNKFIKKINIMSHYRVIHHLIILSLIYIFDTLIIFLIEFKMESHKNLLIKLYQIIIFILTLGIMIFLSKKNKELIGHQVFFKNNIVETIYNNNKVKLIACSEHLMYKYICDLILIIPYFVQIFYKTDTDIDTDSNSTYKFTYFYSSMFAGFIYLFGFGVMMLSVEGTNFSMLPCILKFLFCLKNFNFYFGDGKKLISKILDPDDTNIYNYNIYFNQSKLFNNEEEIINKLNGINDYSGDQSSVSSMLCKSDTKSYNTIKQNINDSKTQSDLLDEKIRELEKERMKKEKEYSPCNFFIIFKLMYLYYNSNIKVFQNVKKASEENGFFNEISSSKNRMTRKTFGRKSNTNSSDSSDKRITIANMKEKLNRVSKVEKEQLSSYKKYNLNQVMSNIQEYSMKTFFIKYLSKNLNKNNEKNINIISNTSNIKETEIELNNKFSLPPEVIKDKSTIFNNSNNNDLSNTNSNINMNSLLSLYNDNNTDIPLYEFKIESLMNTVLLDLFPYYEIDVKDIINSLNVCNNMNLFYSFFKNKNSNKNYNSYYTSDSFLTFEIYDKNFLSYNQLKSFMNNYKKYFLEKISNFSYTFLPLIVGIFNISYLSYDKVIILYRNPLAFTPNISFHYWLKFFFSQEFDKMETSTNSNDVVDINEIEVINNIKLSNEEYSDTINILDEDINFLISSSFNLDFKLNLFILNDVNKQNNLEDSLINKDKNEELNNGKNNITENSNLMNMIRNTELFPGNNAFDPFNFNFKKKIFGSELISLLENLYMSDLNSNNYIFKIYFTEIFKKSDNDKKSNHISNNENRDITNLSGTNLLANPQDSEIKENNQKLCKFLKNKLLRKIGKSNDIFEEEYHD